MAFERNYEPRNYQDRNFEQRGGYNPRFDQQGDFNPNYNRTSYQKPETQRNGSKNAYEIRMDVLSLAKDLLVEEYYVSRQRYLELKANAGDEDLIEDESFFPSDDEVVDAAYKLYEFVSQTDRANK